MSDTRIQYRLDDEQAKAVRKAARAAGFRSVHVYAKAVLLATCGLTLPPRKGHRR